MSPGLNQGLAAARERGGALPRRRSQGRPGLRGHTLAANASLALVGDMLAKAGMFVALLILAHGLAVDEFARLGVAMAAMLIVTSLLDGGIATVATRDGASDATQRLGLLRAGTLARVPLLAAAAAGCLGAGAAVDQLQLAAVVLVAAVVNAAQLSLFAVFRSAQTLVGEAVAKGLCGLSYPLCCVAVVGNAQRTASAALLAMLVGPLVTLPALLVAARALIPHSARSPRPTALLLRAAPFGLIALATLVYYRAPLLLMGLLSSHAQTGSYSVAANIAFAVLMLPAACATGLLPRLAGERDPARRARLIRTALLWSTGILAAVELALAATAWWLVPVLYGPAYRSAVDPLLILLLSGPAIGAAGIIGTALIAENRKRGIIGQVAAALLVNLAASSLLIPALGADGAALATLLTEFLSLGILAGSYRRISRQTAARYVTGSAPKAALVP